MTNETVLYVFIIWAFLRGKSTKARKGKILHDLNCKVWFWTSLYDFDCTGLSCESNLKRDIAVSPESLTAACELLSQAVPSLFPLTKDKSCSHTGLAWY